MNDEPQTTYVRPGYRKTSAGHKPIDGVQFFSYVVSLSSYARISEDGQIKTSDNGHHRSSYSSYVIGHGPLLGPSGTRKRFRSQDAAARAAIKVWRSLRAKP